MACSSLKIEPTAIHNQRKTKAKVPKFSLPIPLKKRTLLTLSTLSYPFSSLSPKLSYRPFNPRGKTKVHMEIGQRGNGTVCSSSESVNGIPGVWSCEDTDASLPDHLLVMIHGILGSAADWKFGAEQFVKILPDKVFVHCSERNASMLTLDGVDVMGERLAQEVLEVIQRKPTLRKISFVAHSAGGLVARYAIGRLYRPSREESIKDAMAGTGEEDSRTTIAGLEPVNFITVATPHLGSRGNKQVPFLFGISALEKAASVLVHWIYKRTGRHLFLVDNDGGRPPLLKRMIEDYGDSFFMSALRTFKRRVVYANVGYDHMVGWRTSSIRRNNELPKWEGFINEKYPHVVYEERCTARRTDQYDEVSPTRDVFKKLEEELVRGLSCVSWEKVDVSFHTCRQRFAAHSVIQVRDQARHMEGADVIQHIIDHFLL